MSSSSSENPIPVIHSNMTSLDAMIVMNKIENIYESFHGMKTWNDCIKDVIKNCKNAEILLRGLSDCQCCFRHSVHRPCYLNDFDWMKHMPIRKVLDNGDVIWEKSYMRCKCFHHDCGFDDSCTCPCRHYSRSLQNIFTSASS